MGERTAELIEQRGEVTISALPVKSVLNQCTGPSRVPMDLTINPYRGCEFGCRYCYARYTHQYLDHPDPDSFEKELYAKTEAPMVLAAELARRNLAGRHIAIGTATDPYQPAERKLEITRGILESLCGCRGARISLLTKSDLVVRDLDVLAKLNDRHQLWVGFTMVTMDRAMQRKLEPRAPTPQKRIEAMASLAGEGISVGVSYAPLMPQINDDEQAITSVLSAVADAGGRFAFAAPLWISSCARPSMFRWLGERFPGLLAEYRGLFEHGVDLPQDVRRRMLDGYRAIAEAHGLGASPFCEQREAVQMTLF